MITLQKFEFQSITVYPEPPKKRRELDVCNVVFCFLVILIHVLAEPVTQYRKDSVLYVLALGPWRLSAYVVQGFLFLAGVKTFLTHKSPVDPFSYSKYAVGRLRRVVLPYLCVLLLFTAYLTGIGQAPESLTAWLWDAVTGRLVGHFYFVPVICQFYLLIPLWRRMVYHGSAVLSLLTSFVIMFLCKLYLPDVLTCITGRDFTGNAVLFTTYLFYFVAGCYCGRYYEHFRAYLRQHAKSVYAGWIFCAAVNWVFIVLNGKGIYYAPWLEGFHVLYCLYAILGSLALADRYAIQHSASSTLMQCINRQSYWIYLLHPLFIFLVNGLCGKIGLHSVSLRFVVRVIAVYFLSVFIVAVPFDQIGKWIRSNGKKAK